jgi:hypothetical protein
MAVSLITLTPSGDAHAGDAIELVLLVLPGHAGVVLLHAAHLFEYGLRS